MTTERTITLAELIQAAKETGTQVDLGDLPTVAANHAAEQRNAFEARMAPTNRRIAELCGRINLNPQEAAELRGLNQKLTDELRAAGLMGY